MIENKPGTNAQEHQLAFEIEHARDYGEYLIQSQAAILGVARSLIKTAAPVRVYPAEKDCFLHTRMLALTPDSSYCILDVDVDVDEKINQRVQGARKLIFAAFEENVKVQFLVDRVWLSSHEGLPAFFVRVPERLLRLQRRRFHRVYPVEGSVKFHVSLRDGEGRGQQCHLPLFDISAGGVGLFATLEQARLLEDKPLLTDCELILPDGEVVVVSVSTRNLMHMTTRVGAHRVRIGCQFAGLSEAKTARVEHWVRRIEREQRARALGLA